jgi:threonine/homoserine/homoserine lactone efflux protein
MDLLPTLAHLAAIHLLMAMVPGPNTVAVSYCAAGISRRAGLQVAGGIALASLIWVSLSLAGIGIVLLEAGAVYRAIRLAGALYLLWVGYKLLRSTLGRQAATASGTPPVYRQPFFAGFITTLSNPKSAIFWTSVFALVVPAHAPVWFYGAVLVIVGVQAFVWYGIVALTLSSGISRRYYTRLTRALNGVAGFAMSIFGLKILNDIRIESFASQD